ncbi:hypothetical protein C8J57DRAFT_459537 [Mycena rebaudengoi]|nr:hypothetical protein C8J57DRAFT_459537 [Mycena rebaudengoi]
MFSRSVYKLTFLVLRLLVFQVSTTATSVPELTLGDFLVHSTLPLDYFDGTITGGQTTTVPWAPTDENLIVNITITQGEPAYVGWTFPSVEGTPDGGTIFDGFAKNITVFYTPPTGSEKMVFSYSTGPDTTNFCGMLSGLALSGLIGSDDLEFGTYEARWIVEFGQSIEPDAPIDPDSGCGAEAFNITTVEFERTWEVVKAA